MPDKHRVGADGELHMSDAEIERVAERVFQKFQAQFGNSIWKASVKMFWIAFLGFLAWAGLVHVNHAAQVAFHLKSQQ